MNSINIQKNNIKIFSYILISFYLIFLINSFFVIFEMNTKKSYNIKYEEIIQNVFYISLNINIQSKKDEVVFHEELNNKINILNDLFNKNSIISGSGFLINKNIITADHVCQEINKFYREDKKLKEIKDFIKTNLSHLERTLFENNYIVNKSINIKNFNNTKYLRTKNIEIKKSSFNLDICIIKQEKYINKKFKFRKTKLVLGEKVINFSFNDNFYKENVLPHNIGYFIGKFKNINHYSLRIHKGSSGSLVFDNKYNIVGMIDSIYRETNISMGTSSDLIYNFINPYNSIYSGN